MKKLLSFSLALFCLFVCFSGCTPSPYSTVLYNKCNTDVQITLYAGGSSKTAAELVKDCEGLLDAAEAVLSRTDAASSLAILNTSSEQTVTVPDMLAEMLSLALSLAKETNGTFDPTAGVLSDLYDITGDTPLPPAAGDIAAALAYVDYRKVQVAGNTVTRTPGTVLDFGAVAKGYLAEMLVDYLEAQGCPGGVLSLGGNVAVFGEKTTGEPFRVAIRHPVGGIAGTCTVKETAYISTSGGYERYRIGEDGKTYHHIFDPMTGKPAESGLSSVTVMCTDGARADALSTALYVMGWDSALAFWESAGDFDMLLIDENGDMYATPGMLFTEGTV